MTGEQLEGLGCSACSVRAAPAVHHDRVATFRGIGQAVQELEARDRVAVGVVGVHLEAEPGIGEVDRGGLGADIEQPAVVGLRTKPKSATTSVTVPGWHGAP